MSVAALRGEEDEARELEASDDERESEGDLHAEELERDDEVDGALATEAVEDFDDADEEPDTAEELPLANFSSLPPAARVVREESSASDSMLSRYFREMACHPVLGPEEELERAQEVEVAELSHWIALFGHPPAAIHALHALEDALPSGDDALEIPELDALRQLIEGASGKLPRAVRKRYDALVLSMARRVRFPDTDRQWLAACEEAVRRAATPQHHAGLQESQVQLVQRPASIEDTDDYRQALAAIERASSHAARVKNQFVKSNLRLVVSIARRYNRGRLPLIDLIQEGNIGLMKAVERFDHTRGYRFSTYASWWIRHSISRALADKGRAVRIPVHMLDTHNRVQRATQALISRTGNQPTPEELERETGIPQDKLDKMVGSWAETPFSLDRTVGDDDGRRFVDFLPDEVSQSPHETLVSQKWSEEVQRLLALLSPIESRIIRWRFGIDDEDELTLKEIGDKYNLSRERIRQLQEQALGKIRRQMRD